MHCTNCVGSLAAVECDGLVPILRDGKPVGYFCSPDCEEQFKLEFPAGYANLTGAVVNPS